VTPPLLHFSLFPSHLAQIEIPLSSQPPSQLNFLFSFSLSHLLSLSLSLPLSLDTCSLTTFFSNRSSSDSSHRYLILSVPFSLSYPSSILLTNPTCMRLFPPRCFNHLYLFQFSALFFLSPSDQTGEAFILTPYPLICTAMRPAIPNMPHPITFVTPSELDPAKTSSSARSCRLFFIITSIRQSGP
jgi:hypothetical protein